MRVVMLTDDIQIDRRIVLEAESLHDQGYEVILLAERGTGADDIEWIGNLKVERMKTPELSKSELFLLRISALLNAALGRISALIIRFFGLIISLISKFFSFLIRINQKVTALGIRIVRKLRLLPLRERALIDRIEFYNPDIIHAHDLPQLRAAVKAKKRLKIPLVYDAHELYPEIGTLTAVQQKMLSRRERKYIQNTDAVITVNKYIAEEMAKRYKLDTPHVVLNATNWPSDLPRSQSWDRFREKFRIPVDHCILLFQGWMSLHRGLQPLVYSMKLLPEHVHLVFMGYGEARDVLEGIVAKEFLQERVHFMDAVPQSELLSWTSSADVGIIPYQPVDLNNYYCSPNKLFEFIQAGLPIVANDLPFLRDLITSEEFGVVFKLEEAQDYASAIQSILEGNKLRHCKEKLQQRKYAYSWSTEEAKLFAVYESLGLPGDRLALQKTKNMARFS